MARNGFEGSGQAVYVPPVTPAEASYARQIGLDPGTLNDPGALERLRRVRAQDNMGVAGVCAAELDWMLGNAQVEKGVLDFSN